MNKQKVIEKIINQDLTKNSKNYFKQISIFKSLIKEYSEPLFWHSVSFGDQISSLFFFKTEEGSRLLDLKYKEYLKHGAKQKTLKFNWGDDIEVSTKTKTTKSFLNE